MVTTQPEIGRSSPEDGSVKPEALPPQPIEVSSPVEPPSKEQKTRAATIQPPVIETEARNIPPAANQQPLSPDQAAKKIENLMTSNQQTAAELAGLSEEVENMTART